MTQSGQIHGELMPIHDWTKVEAGIFHDFHQEWISTIKRSLNGGLLPPGYYALAEQIASGYGPDVLTLEGPMGSASEPSERTGGGINLATAPPRVSFHFRTEADIYATKANRISVRHVSDHRVVAIVEIVSPGNKSTRGALRDFTGKAADLLRRGVHLLVVDLFPPGHRDPEGIHGAIWEELADSDFVLPEGRPLTLASYVGGATQEAFVETIAAGSPLPDMPLFLAEEQYVPIPLEKTYQSAWEAVPEFWRGWLNGK